MQVSYLPVAQSAGEQSTSGEQLLLPVLEVLLILQRLVLLQILLLHQQLTKKSEASIYCSSKPKTGHRRKRARGNDGRIGPVMSDQVSHCSSQNLNHIRQQVATVQATRSNQEFGLVDIQRAYAELDLKI
ncbi:hypothetical protein CEXT_523261 [Caerostris extrusa]|uniref:Uncharacterized protein n=1 Tax=Caerostris extrusa TaxID=172846 RepID=A0AAV4XZT5_CAEEX|nr:hypothetical protein CEXT_523261 [Caerostris extrusa]